ncbi:MAG: hypothetical protein M9921_02935 [Fimbriimonadaceae bacterium]|nr:hypothetical protein [Fimbriimonadaceae bacterium]
MTTLLACVCLLSALPTTDWLIDPSPFKAAVTADGKTITLQNGLVSRVVRISPNAATISLRLGVDGTEFVRAVRPEAVIELDGRSFNIGGLDGQPVQNYLDPRWLETMTSNPAAFQYRSHRVGSTVARFPWQKRSKWMARDVPWPPPGKSLVLTFAAPEGDVTVEVHYEIYDGLPLISKWIVVRNGTDRAVRLNRFVCEELAVVESESIVDDTSTWRPSNLFVETDYTFGGMSGPNHSAGVHWVADPDYPTQVNYNRKTPCLLECRPPLGPDQIVPPGESFESFRVFEMPLDSSERERQTLAVRRIYRTVSPWVAENPILMHVRSAAPEAVKLAVDQCAAVGFEMVIMTFGSGFDFESRDPKYQQQIKELADYAHSKGIALGGYSLLASRGAADKADNTQGSPARYGVMPCLGAQWGVDYLAQLKRFIEVAGLDVLEHDGSYPGDLCAATDHPYHRGLDDSQWVMWRAITDFYSWCRGNGTYLNIPDWYFLNGGTKTAMGYRETNWSLPREFQEIIERQNVFDGTWDKAPSMGWMFVPLTEYQGGGGAATIEPLKEHLAHYEQRLANLFGAGVQACYRGPRLYDAPETEAVVKKWVDFYKKHRAILDSDIIHLRRADGRDIDYLLHVNPALKEKGLLMVYNPLDRPVTRTLEVPLYYTGLKGSAAVLDPDGNRAHVTLDALQRAPVKVTVAAFGSTHRLFE